MDMQKLESGWYWCFILDDEGNPLESPDNPNIVKYYANDNSINFIGYDCSVRYNPKHYRLLERIIYSPKT